MSDLSVEINHSVGPNLFVKHNDGWGINPRVLDWLDKNTPGYVYTKHNDHSHGVVQFTCVEHVRKFRQSQLWDRPQDMISQVLGTNMHGDPCLKGGDPYHFLLVVADEYQKKSQLGNGYFSAPEAVIEAKLRALHEKLHGLVNIH